MWCCKGTELEGRIDALLESVHTAGTASFEYIPLAPLVYWLVLLREVVGETRGERGKEVREGGRGFVASTNRKEGRIEVCTKEGRKEGE